LVFDAFLAAHGPAAVLGAVLALALGGFAKGVVGFALPLIAVSGMGMFLPYEVAVGLLILPTLVSNLFQATRNGVAEARRSLVKFWRLNTILVVMIAASAQLVVVLSDQVLFAMLGVSITFFGFIQLAGWRPRLPAEGRRRWEVGSALVGGFFGGLSGIWGPPIVMYLLATDLPKAEMVRVQALCFLAGSIVMVGAHIASGVLDGVTAPLSLALVVPTLLAMFAGYVVQDRLDQALFRKVTLAVLVLAGLNLIRRAIAA
jgi:uncharacterized protein